MIIDCHGHFTTTPPAVGAWRESQVRSLVSGGPFAAASGAFDVSDDEICDAISGAQLAEQDARGIDLTLFSPRASWMAHHVGDIDASTRWAMRQNDLVHRVAMLFPGRFAPVAQLPQSPGSDLRAAVRELRRCVEELGFVGCNINPDPTGGLWAGPSLSDPIWWPLWDEMERLDVAGMIHVSASARPAIHATGGYYLAADTIAFMQLLSSDVFAEHPGLRLVLPHGGGAVPFHWGRYRGLALENGWDLDEVLRHVWFDTCVYHQPGIDLLVQVVPPDNLLFGSEMIGAVRGIDPVSGAHFDDTARYIASAPLTIDDRERILYRNALRVYPGLGRWIQQ